jgi:hypothetical protein
LDINNDDDVLVGSTINPSKKQRTPLKTTERNQITKESSDYIEVMGSLFF